MVRIVYEGEIGVRWHEIGAQLIKEVTLDGEILPLEVFSLRIH